MEQARLNLSNGKLLVSWTGDLPPAQIAHTVSSLGYGVSAHSEDESSKAAKSEERALLISMGIAAFALANIMLLSVSVWGGHGEMGDQTRVALHGISGLIALPVLLFSGRHFFTSAFAALRHGHANMDVPISLALTLAFGVSVWETATAGAHAYFDASVMLLFFLLTGRFLDARLRRQAHAAAHDLAALQNRSVNRLTRDGRIEPVRADQIKQGDTVILAAGERTVIDLKISNGTGEIDESMVTGESLPRTIGIGETLYAGSLNLDTPLSGTALGEAADSLLSDIGRMLEGGRNKNARALSPDRRQSRYALCSICPHNSGPRFPRLDLPRRWRAHGDYHCRFDADYYLPMCFGARRPLWFQVVAAGRLFKRGTFLRSGDALERFAEIDHVVLDKTGTLTLGTPQLVSEHGSELALAGQLARASRHPLSRALVAAAGPGPLAADAQEHPGLGLEGQINGVPCRLGSAEWVGLDAHPDTDGPALWFVMADSDPIQFRFEDRLQSDAETTIATLRARGISVEILSGDGHRAVEKIANTLGIQTWQAKVSPQDKADRLKLLDEEGKKVLMVGDGLNDAGALAIAHASLAPGGAMDVSQAASDAVYAGGLSAIEHVLNVSTRAKSVMLQNFGLAAAYNLIAVPIAVTGHVHGPLIAAIAMSASSLIVTLNALRLNGGAS